MSFAQREVPRLFIYDNITDRQLDMCMGDDHCLLLPEQEVCLLIRQHGLICFCLSYDRPA